MLDFSDETFMDNTLNVDKLAKFQVLGTFKFNLGRSGCLWH